MKILVVGGAGYIGSHMTKLLHDCGHAVMVLDNLCSGHRDAVLGGEFVEGDLSDGALLDRVFLSQRFDGVMHFASFIQVGESVAHPARYYRNNVAGTVNLVNAMVKHYVRRLIFSSSAAIFGEPQTVPIAEDHPQAPGNPYGRSKLMVEQMLADYDHAYGLRHSCLRYFNAAGADPGGRLGERHDPETHLIPLVLRAASGKLPSIKVFGTDYDTPDGTCIRDYVHVADLCVAHLQALERLMDGAPSREYNLGNGNGYSVQQVIAAASRVASRPVTVVAAPRRAGDPARLVADSQRAREELSWSPRYADLDTIIAHAWRWQQTGAGRDSTVTAAGAGRTAVGRPDVHRPAP